MVVVQAAEHVAIDIGITRCEVDAFGAACWRALHPVYSEYDIKANAGVCYHDEVTQ